MPRIETSSGREHRRQIQLDLLAAAAGQQRDLPRIPLHPDAAGVRPIGQRMPDELHLDPVPPVELALKRKDDQHLAHVALHQLDASFAPGPELRADVVNHRNTAAMQLPRQAEIELREIDQHGHVGTPPVDLGQQMTELAIDARQVRRHFGQPQHRNVPGVDHGLATGGAQTLPAQPEALDPCGRCQLAQSRQQRRAVHVAGGFAGGDHEPHRTLSSGRPHR